MNTTTQTPCAMDAIITEHNTADNAMIQHFGDRSVRIVTDNATHRTGVFVNEELRGNEKNLTVAEYEAVQQSAFLVWLSMR